MADDPTIVSAVGTAAASSLRGDVDLAARIEAAMSQAVTQALADGIPIEDSATIKARMMDARAKVLAE